MPRRTVVSAFTGIGGLDAGLEAAGFDIVSCVEQSPVARKALELLRPRWPLHCTDDIRRVNAKDLLVDAGVAAGDVTILAGGPPCQPFSRAGGWSKTPARFRDPRAGTISAFFRVAQVVQPEVILIENVPQLVSLARGEATLRAAFTRLNRVLGTSYVPSFLTVEASDYGVPQRRRRVFIVAHRDANILELPSPTHGEAPGLLRRANCWDALGELDRDDCPDSLTPKGYWSDLLPSIPEGKNYLFHTSRGGGSPLFGWRTKFWSFLLKLAKDRPAWTIQATPGPATGPFHWRSRRLSFYELAALQTVPISKDPGLSLHEGQRLLGNAVPSAIGELLGRTMRREFWNDRIAPTLTLIPHQQTKCPEPEPPLKVPRRYYMHIGNHAEHPGPGLGPGADNRLANSMERPGRGRKRGRMALEEFDAAG